jgi:Gram-negative bacterial TonB protein C-terminal
MKRLICLFILFVLQNSFSQIMGEDEVYLKGERIDASFNGGGIDNFYKFINATFDFSKVKKEGTMITSFTINENGEIKNSRVTQFLDVESATEIIRVLKLAPKWKPATRMGKPIAVNMKFPLNFTLSPVKTNEVKVKENADNYSENNIYNVSGVETKPEFTGGINNFHQFIGNNFKVPEVKNLAGKIIVQFVIEKDGTVTDIKVLKDIGYGTEDEAIRVLKLSPNWIPAQQNGKLVRCQFVLPISIKLK